MRSPSYLVVLASVMAFPCVAAAQGTSLVEREPNDSSPAAALITIGDAFSGQINPAGDLDYFSLDVTAGTELVVAGRTDLSLEVALLDVDGKTWLASMPTLVEDDAPLRYPITVSGHYFIVVTRSNGSASYSLRATGVPFKLGPGDPATTIAEIHPYLPARALVANRTGDWFFLGGGAVMRLGGTGEATPFVTGHSVGMTGLAIDGFGNLLVPAEMNQIWKFTPDGVESLFYTFDDLYQMSGPMNITVGPDGDVWVAAFGDTCDDARNQCHPVANLWRFNPLGRLKDSVDLRAIRFDGHGVRWMGFSPAGDLHFTSSAGIYKLANHQLEFVFSFDPSPSARPYGEVGTLAFARDGSMYVAARGQVLLLGPSYRIEEAIANIPNFSGGLAFARDRSGRTTSRLVVGRSSELAQLNPAGIRGDGWPIGRQTSFTETQVQDGVLRRGMVGKVYADTLRVLALPGPVTWRLASGVLPPGITLDPSTGILTGVPRLSGSFSFEARVTSGSRNATGRFTGTVSAYRLATPIYRIAEAAMGGAPLSIEETQYLDKQGNGNGALDIGDLRAYLRSLGYIAGTKQP